MIDQVACVDIVLKDTINGVVIRILSEEIILKSTQTSVIRGHCSWIKRWIREWFSLEEFLKANARESTKVFLVRDVGCSR